MKTYHLKLIEQKFYEYRKPREKTKNNLIPEVWVEKGQREDGRAGCVG